MRPGETKVSSTHPDRLRWNEKYAAAEPAFAPHPLLAEALAVGVPEGPALELACGPSGSALALLALGREVVAVDISDVALAQLQAEARRRGLSGLTTRLLDLGSLPELGGFALVLCTRFWLPAALRSACAAVAPGGVLAWEAFRPEHLGLRPGFRLEWCLGPGEPASLLPSGFEVLSQRDLEDEKGASRRLVARRGS